MKAGRKSLNFKITVYVIVATVALLILFSYYFFYMRRTMRREIYDSLTRDGAYVSGRVSDVINNVIDTAKGPGYNSALQRALFSDDAGEKLQNISTSRELIATARDQNEYIMDLFYYSDTGHLYTVSEYYDRFRNNMKLYGFDQEINLEQSFISDVPLKDKSATFYFLYTPIYRTAVGIAHRSRERGICAILFDFKPIVRNCEDIIGANDSCYYVFNNEIVSSIRPVDSVASENLIHLRDGDKEYEFGGVRYFVHVYSDEDGKYVSLAPVSLLEMKNMTLDKTFVVVAIFLLVLFGVFFFFIARLEYSARREQETREMLLSATVAQQEAEMMAYRSQINPHFFFNTLECVRSMAQFYNAEMIEDIVSAMSKMFRYSLYSDMTVSLSAEIDMLEQYFRITSYRFPDKYVLNLEIDDSTVNYRVPSMILQPLVENSIKHAFINTVEGKKNIVTVRASFTENGLLKLTVKDNGCGMSTEELNALRTNAMDTGVETARKDSIGIKNIYERIKLFDERNEMQFYSEPGEYTKVELILYPAKIKST